MVQSQVCIPTKHLLETKFNYLVNIGHLLYMVQLAYSESLD